MVVPVPVPVPVVVVVVVVLVVVEQEEVEVVVAVVVGRRAARHVHSGAEHVHIAFPGRATEIDRLTRW